MNTYVNQHSTSPERLDDSDDDYQEGYERVGRPTPAHMPTRSGSEAGEPADTVEVPQVANVRRRKNLILVGCILVNLGQSVVFSMAVLGKIKSDLSNDEADTIRMALLITRRLGVPFASLLMIGMGYRIVGIIGCSLVGLGLFIASWVPRVAVGTITFLVGGVAGLGFAFLSLTVIVPILETFTKHRLRYLVMVRSAESVSSIVFASLTLVPDIEIDWRILYRYQLVVMVVAGAACVLLKPLETIKADVTRGVIGRLLGLSDFSLFKGVTLYLLILVYVLDQIGIPTTRYDLSSLLEDPTKQFGADLSVRVIVILPFVGNLLGLLALVFWKMFSLVDILQMLGPVNIACGLLTLQVPALDKVAWVAVYAVVFGMSSGVFLALTDNVIPGAFGKQSIRIVEGILGLASGVGLIIALPASNALSTQTTHGYESSFYLSGSALVISGLLAVGFRFVLLRQNSKKENSR
ncbi:uncharacterized protein LOC110450997 [Mizuhopecten yessoensis]|uniref:Major facilitator superfamily (MFS) profile domain-containing protein n=1 Tax=Mizuhopecten yessoensis TaxID=6573 RepID=A0A210R5A1_MIZYE|nr:uncharacterized protein LOC110450997 [Mizuhopecten yessoensis]OWF56145.1 hypothetical protein KP79_PYT14737 [Mizuhopecten yessoensis]